MALQISAVLRDNETGLTDKQIAKCQELMDEREAVRREMFDYLFNERPRRKDL